MSGYGSEIDQIEGKIRIVFISSSGPPLVWLKENFNYSLMAFRKN